MTYLDVFYIELWIALADLPLILIMNKSLTRGGRTAC
jgi:hypothetical protein